jgi:hypothetical protein
MCSTIARYPPDDDYDSSFQVSPIHQPFHKEVNQMVATCERWAIGKFDNTFFVILRDSARTFEKLRRREGQRGGGISQKEPQLAGRS